MVNNLTVTTVIFVIGFILALLIRDHRKRGSFCMGCFRSNQGYMGLPAINGFYGSEAMSRAAVVNGFDSPLVIVLSVFALEIFRGIKRDKGDKTKSAAQMAIGKFISFMTNPFIISSVLALLLSYLNVPVLKFKILDEFLKVSAGMALPLALLSIGCSIEIKHLASNLRLLLGASVVKLLIMPAVAFVLAYWVFGFRGVDLGMSVILLSTPSSVSSYIMACEMDADGELSATIIGFTTFWSVVSISIIQFVLKSSVI